MSQSILFLGSSLVAGTLGVNWINLLPKSPEKLYHNYGINGAHIVTIIDQLESPTAIPSSLVPTKIVLMIGGNDVTSFLLPESHPYYETYTKPRLSRPKADLDRFESDFKELMDLIVRRFGATIPVCVFNIKPVGEDIKGKLNLQIVDYNLIIEKLVRGYPNLVYLDLFNECKKIMPENDKDKWVQSDDIDKMVVPSRMVNAKLISLITFGFMSHNSIGELYGFYSTCDGSHFNERSAELVVNLISNFLSSE